jgi:hypothetical protein
MDRDTAIGMSVILSRADTGTTITAITDQGNTRASTINPQQSPAPSVTFLRAIAPVCSATWPTAKMVGSIRSLAFRCAPVLHCLRAFRQIAGSAGSREIDEGIGTAAAERKDMIGLELLV